MTQERTQNNYNQDNDACWRLWAPCKAELTILFAVLCTQIAITVRASQIWLFCSHFTSSSWSSWPISPLEGPNHLQHRPLLPPHQPHKRVWFIIVVGNIRHECCTHCYCQYWRSSIVYYFHVMFSTSTTNTSNLNFNTPWHVVAVTEVSFVAIASNLKKKI